MLAVPVFPSFPADPAQRARLLRVGYRQNRFLRALFGGACGVLDPARPDIGAAGSAAPALARRLSDIPTVIVALHAPQSPHSV